MRYISGLFSISFVIIVLSSGISYAAENEFSTFDVGSSPYGISDKEWIGKWWQWYLSVPKTHSPNNLDYPNHIKNVTCSIFQDPSSPVFFLFTPYVDEKMAERTCIVPKDKAILIPTVAGIMDTGDPTLTDKSDQALIGTVTEGNNNAVILAKLDDSTLNFNHDEKYRLQTNFFNITLPEHNIWEEKEKPGTYRAIADGYYLFLKPLSSGNHTLYYEAGTTEPNPNQYVQSVTYHLIVK